MPSALVLLAEGAEEMETVIIVDVLRRAQVDVTLAGVDDERPVRCSRGVVLSPDCPLSESGDSFDVVVLPGGAGGAERLGNSAAVGETLRRQWDDGRLVAAICAAPTALKRHGIARGLRLTSHPSVRAELEPEYVVVDDDVVDAGQLVTSQGPGTSFAFALRIVEKLCGKPTAEAVRSPLRLPGGG
jgi:protein DJ-1